MRMLSLLAACPVALLAWTTAAFGQDGRLPIGVTLLGADTTSCRGALMLESGLGEENDEVSQIRAGEYAVFLVEEPNLAWVCLNGEGATSSDTMECPAQTSHVRILREADEELVLFECYGRQA